MRPCGAMASTQCRPPPPIVTYQPATGLHPPIIAYRASLASSRAAYRVPPSYLSCLPLATSSLCHRPTLLPSASTCPLLVLALPLAFGSHVYRHLACLPLLIGPLSAPGPTSSTPPLPMPPPPLLSCLSTCPSLPFANNLPPLSVAPPFVIGCRLHY